MSLSVTSHFRSKMESTNPSSMVEVFTFANSDLSSRVKAYPTISRDAKGVVGSNYSIEVENASQTFNSLETDRTQFFQDGSYEFGFSTESGTNDTIQLFGGELTSSTFKETSAKLVFEDRLARLKQKRIGSRQSPVSFTNTQVNPADLAWWVATSYGGMSSVKSDSNPDIKYQSWVDYFNIFDSETITVMANFEGDTVIEGLEKIQQLTDSTIYAEGDNKLYFNRWTGVSSDSITVTDSFIQNKNIQQTINGNSIVNNVTVQVSYNPSSDTWGTQTTFVNTASVNSFGTFEAVFDDETVWYVDDASASNLAQRLAFRRSQPGTSYKFKTPLNYLDAQLGDEVILTTQVYSLSAKELTLQKYTISTNGKKTGMTLEADEGFGRGGGRIIAFILDDPVLGLLDETNNPLL